MKRIPQHEFSFDSEPFALVAQATQDGAGIVAEREQVRSDREASAALQVTLGASYEVDRGEMSYRGNPMPDCCQTPYERKAMASLHKSPGLAPGSFWTVEGKGTL